MLQREIALPDGRRLGNAEWGQRAGPPALHFHGVPISLIVNHAEEVLRSLVDR
jgi:hypothetical protein